MSRRSSLFLAFHVGVSAGGVCEPLTAPTACLMDSTCAWLTLEGECRSHDHFLTEASPPSCCASQHPESHCVYKTADIPDGSCQISLMYEKQATYFDIAYATRMTHLASAAYCESEVNTWSCGFHCDSVSGLSMIQYVYYKPANLAGFVAWDSEQDAIVVSFRGTQGTSIRNWLKNLDAFTTKPYSQYPKAKVHGGFHQAWVDLRPDIMAAVAKVQAEHSTNIVLVTGHSLGAAIASVAAFDMKLNYGLSPSLIDLGRPRVGNYEFAEALSVEISSVFRMTHHDDLVPHAPPEFSGFYHSGDEIFFRGDGTSFASCDGSGEDSDCSDRCSPLFCTSIDDHLFYLGMTIGSDACGSSRVV